MTTTCTMILGDFSSVDVEKKHALTVADLPFGVSSYEWDNPVDLGDFWRIVGDSTCASFANLSFLWTLIQSNKSSFRYEIVWNQGRGWTPFLANKMPMRSHQFIGIFGRTPIKYYSQKTSNHKRVVARQGTSRNIFYGMNKKSGFLYDSSDRHPLSVLTFDCDKKTRYDKTKGPLVPATHPSAKPVALIDWILKSYSNAGDMVLDPTAGSFTTCVAAASCGRSSIGIERDEGYFEAGVDRVRKHIRNNLLDVKLEVRK